MTRSLRFCFTHLDINDFIPDERLQEHAHEPNQSVLHVLVLDILAARDTIGYVEMNELCWQIYAGSQSIYHLVQHRREGEGWR